MTGRLNSLSNVRELLPIQVCLSDGNNAVAVKGGKLCLGNGLYLYQVLFVPTMNCILILFLN